MSEAGSVRAGAKSPVVCIVGAGYAGKMRLYRRMVELGARLVVVDEPEHWSQQLVADGIAEAWLPVEVVGEPDRDAAAVLSALREGGVHPDGVMTFWEDSVAVASRVAAALSLPGNPPHSVDTCRSKFRTRELSARVGLPTGRSVRVGTEAELLAAAEVIGFPAVLKPEFGASAMGVIKVPDAHSMSSALALVRSVVTPEYDTIFRAGEGLLLEEYLDGVEFDVDVIMHDGLCIFSSVSQNWPTAEPSFQETGLHCPPDHDARQVTELVNLVVRTAQAFELANGVLHIEAKCTSRGPRVVEVNPRMGGGRVYEMVKAVWNVDLVAAQLRSCLGLPPDIEPSSQPLLASVGRLVHAPVSGRLVSLPIAEEPHPERLSLYIDIETEVGEHVVGPEAVFATVLADVTVMAPDLATARAVADHALERVPEVWPLDEASA